MKVVALAGGTGSAKLLRGLKRLDHELTVIANVGDNVWMYGVYICPDVDIACYALAGLGDAAKGWGIRGDTFEVMEALKANGGDAWFALGDRDLATCLRRTEMLRSGKSLTEAVSAECMALGLESRVLPVTDRHVETRIRTPGGDLHLQEFWVREGGKPKVEGVYYKGARSARVSPSVAAALGRADRVVICPANPVTSISPMLAVPGFKDLLSESGARVVALSPMVGKSPFSGPAKKLMRATGVEEDSAGVARLYSEFLDQIFVSRSDAGQRTRIESMGVECVATDTMIRGPDGELRLARELVA